MREWMSLAGTIVLMGVGVYACGKLVWGIQTWLVPPEPLRKCPRCLEEALERTYEEGRWSGRIQLECTHCGYRLRHFLDRGL